ncbi:ATP-binding protein [Pseudomonas siliginis]|uniref:ATP-binding protein n=1 Tax=Pseudomonas siliginis TaxID=2842346 RepID=UPI003869FACD
MDATEYVANVCTLVASDRHEYDTNAPSEYACAQQAFWSAAQPDQQIMTGSVTGAVSQSPIAFGYFHLFPAQRLLLKKGEPVELGSRALDILVALITHRGEVVNNRDLVRMVWQGVVVDESCLRVHISALRKVLSCSETNVSYIANIPGRGYSFVAPISLLADAQNEAVPPLHMVGKIPSRLTRMIGRDDAVASVADELKTHRFVTISGTGGIGKTVVAIAVAHLLKPKFDGSVIFLDLGSVADAQSLLATLATAVGMQYHGTDMPEVLTDFLRSTSLVVIFDSCDHLIHAVTSMAEMLYAQVPDIHILVTSRELLRAEGEFSYRLCPLSSPPEYPEITAADAMAYPAVQLFVERITHHNPSFVLSDSEARTVAHICRKLDGIALAIELSAGQAEAYGIQGIADLLNNRFCLFWSGRRNAIRRHQTLNALLDWSYDLLSETEATVLRRLSVLNDRFSLEVAVQIVKASFDEMVVIDAIGQLVKKSLLLTELLGRDTYYRLPYTTRTYALEKLHSSGEFDIVKERHAVYLVSLLERMNVPSETLPEYERIQRYVEHLGNICAALDWAFSEAGNLALGIRLAAASAPLFLGLSMLDECRRWSGRVLAAGVCEPNGLPQETIWQEALAISTMFALGKPHSGNAAQGVERVFDKNLGDTLRQIRMLGGSGNVLTKPRHPHDYSQGISQSPNLGDQISDPKGIAIMQWMLGDAEQQMSTFSYPRAGVNLFANVSQDDVFSFNYDYRVRALSSLARITWLRGYPEQAVQIGRQALNRANNLRHPATICLSLIYVSTVFLWTGDWRSARESIDQLNSTAKENSFEADLAVGIGLEGILLYSQGDIEAGVERLNGCLQLLSVEHHQVLATMFIRCLAEGFAAAGRFDNALEIVCGALEMVENIGETFDTPEILRIAADLYAIRPHPNFALAEQYLNRALVCAERQSALAWELRIATSLARLRLRQGRGNEAGVALRAVFEKFSEGFDTLDMREAKQLMQSMNSDCDPLILEVQSRGVT